MTAPGADAGAAGDGGSGDGATGEQRPAGAPGGRRTPEWERARRRAEVFGETLPETTSDERGPGSRDPRDGDSWLREQVPPHHGG